MKDFKETEVRDYFYESLKSFGFIFGFKELNIEGLRIDIFAIDEHHVPYIIEFKKSKNRHIVGQSAQYLAVIPAYRKEIAEKINFHKIDWEKLTIILVAPEFHERDFTSGAYEPLKGRIHFYEFDVIEGRRGIIFGLKLRYKGPAESGPMTLPETAVDYLDLVDVSEQFKRLKTRESKREFYTIHILPVLEDFSRQMKDDFEKVGLYPHTSFYDYEEKSKESTGFDISFCVSKKNKTHASIRIAFFGNAIEYGFILNYSIVDGKKMWELLKDPDKMECMVKNILSMKDDWIHIPNTGIDLFLPISGLNERGLKLLLLNYTPKIRRDCLFSISKSYDGKSLRAEDAVKLLKEQYEKFKFIFDMLKGTSKDL